MNNNNNSLPVTDGMNSEEFRKRGKEMVDYIADYLDTIENRRVTPAIEPGYLKKLVPLEAPEKGEDWDDIMKDVENKIMPGVSILSRYSEYIYTEINLFN